MYVYPEHCKFPKTAEFLTSVKQLDIKLHYYEIFLSNLNGFSERFINLEKLNIQHYELGENINFVLTFIQHSTKLKKIKISCGKTFVFRDLPMWQKVREKLVGAKQVTIYVDDDVNVATKWALKTTDFPLIELKRAESCDWFRDLAFRKVD